MKTHEKKGENCLLNGSCAITVLRISASEKYTKPKRPCPFCLKKVKRLLRHLKDLHPEEEDVRQLKKAHGRKQKSLSDALRKRGILLWNRKQAETDEPAFEGERATTKSRVHCSLCNGFYSRYLFYRHKATCEGRACSVESAVATEPLPTFFEDVVSKIQKDEVGMVAKCDPTIRLIGERLYAAAKKKVDKAMEMRHNTMSSMRLLARILIGIQRSGLPSADGRAVFDRKNFKHLEAAIQGMTADDNGLKHGLKQKVLYLLRSAANVLKGTLRSQMKDQEAEEINYFLEVLSLNQNSLFGDAAFSVMKNRHEVLRMPEQLPDEDDVTKLRMHILKQIAQLSKKFKFCFGTPLNDYVALRDALCARITLFNGRRGNETPTMKICHFQDALSRRWVQREANQSEEDAAFLKKFLITYIAGKGNRMVPIIIPSDTIEGMKILVDTNRRTEVGIPSSNQFAFANTGHSSNHVLGWACINTLCLNAEVKTPHRLTATKQRHRLSTRFATLETTESERRLIYNHFGHEPQVNETSYQHPLAFMELTTVGKQLAAIDEGELQINGMIV